MAVGELWEVFARKTREEPLEHIGTINATNPDFARVYARSTYDEENWVEMVVARRASLVPVIELEPLVKAEEVER